MLSAPNEETYMKIGNIDIPGKVVLGPMAGITTLAYREFMKPFGVGLSYTEMVSDCGLDYKNKRTYEYLQTSPADSPIGIQLLGFSLEHTVPAIKICEQHGGYDILDINLGCPVTKVVKTGAGSSWLKDPDSLYLYMKGVVEASSKPVTAKIRLGWDEKSINVFEVAKKLQQAGVAAITVHCRTRSQGYSGAADYQAIAGLKETLSIPLIVSGDIFTPEKALEAVSITHADAVMVARGGVGHPYLVTQINEYLNTGILLPNPDAVTQAEYALDFGERLIKLKGEDTGVKELRGILPHFFSGFPGYKKLRNEIAMNIKTEEDVRRLCGGVILRGGC